MYDAVIVGARCAGSPLALRLARAGQKVLLVDRARFPSDTMSTHFVQAPGMFRLMEWGLVDSVFESNCPPISKAIFDLGDGGPIEFEIPISFGIPGLAAPRRYILDKIVLDAALAAGAEFAEGVSVDSLITEDDRVVGVRGHTSGGAFEARGRVVVGADGRHSVVARETEAPFVRNDGDMSSGYYTYFRGVHRDAVETYLHDETFGIMFPTNDDAAVVAVGWRNELFKEKRRDIEGNFYTSLDGMGDLGQRARAGERTERFVGSGDVPNFLRKAYGLGWALIGDACYHKDPVPADGITDAFRAADYLADALIEIAEGTEEDVAMKRFEDRHAEIALPLLDAAVRTANFDLPPQQRFEAFIEIRMHDGTEVEELKTKATL